MKLRKTIAIGAAAAGFLTLGLGTAQAGHGAGGLTIGLDGENEVGTMGDPDASGNITLDFFAAVDNPTVVFPNEEYVCFELNLDGIEIDDVTGLHIHEVSGNEKNPKNDNGGVVVNLTPGIGAEDQCVSLEANETSPGVDIAELKDEPREYYVNLHTAEDPAGAIRGQFHTFK